MNYPTHRIAQTTAFVTPVMEQWLEQEIVQWVHPMKYRSDDPSHHGATPRSPNVPRILLKFTIVREKPGIIDAMPTLTCLMYPII